MPVPCVFPFLAAHRKDTATIFSAEMVMGETTCRMWFQSTSSGWFFSFRWSCCGAAVIAGCSALQDEGDQLLRVFGALQSTVDGVGQADYFSRGLIRPPVSGIMLRDLTGNLREQGVVWNGNHGAAASTFEIQSICPAVLSGQPVQCTAALNTVQQRFQAEHWAIRLGSIAGGFLVNVLLCLLEYHVVQDGGIAVPAL